VADGVCRTAAVVAQLIIARISLNELVLLERVEQVEKRPRRNAELRNCIREGDRHRVARPAIVAAEQFVAPPTEERECLRPPAGLVAEVVGPTAEAVDGGKVLEEPPRKEKRGDAEVLGVPPG